MSERPSRRDFLGVTAGTVAATLGSLLVAGGTIFYKRWRDGAAADGGSPHTHTRLRI